MTEIEEAWLKFLLARLPPQMWKELYVFLAERRTGQLAFNVAQGTVLSVTHRWKEQNSFGTHREISETIPVPRASR